MSSNEFYHLVMVCAAFALFGLSVATSYARYRRLLRTQTRRRQSPTSSS